jgi:hypothetical protein
VSQARSERCIHGPWQTSLSAHRPNHPPVGASPHQAGLPLKGRRQRCRWYGTSMITRSLAVCPRRYIRTLLSNWAV